jgi:hypothetical protein
MARKRGKRRASSRRRRRSRVGKTAAVALRRRGVTVYRSNPRRRRFRRNPGGGGTGVVATLKTGVKDGAIILASQIAARKAINIVSGFNPIKGIAGTAISGLGVPVVLAIVARKVAPAQARLIAGAAFAEGLRGIISATPAAGLLAGMESDGTFLEGLDADGQLDAWPSVPQIGAYPTLGDDVEYAQ